MGTFILVFIVTIVLIAAWGGSDGNSGDYPKVR